MTVTERADVKRWVETWVRADPELQKVRDADIRAADTAGMIECSAGLFRDAVRSFPPQPTSGLIEQQFWFKRLRQA